MAIIQKEEGIIGSLFHFIMWKEMWLISLHLSVIDQSCEEWTRDHHSGRWEQAARRSQCGPQEVVQSAPSSPQRGLMPKFQKNLVDPA